LEKTGHLYFGLTGSKSGDGRYVKFPRGARGGAQVRDRLDLWYAQRRFDVEVFARSATVTEGLSRLSGRGGERQRAEVEQYLRYVRQDLSQYLALFALDASGRIVIAAGGVGHSSCKRATPSGSRKACCARAPGSAG
jgi:hypothetical protein